MRKHYDEVYLQTLLPIQIKVVAMEKVGAPENIITDIQYKETSFTGMRRFNIQGDVSESPISANVSFKLKEPIYDWHLWGILISGFPLKHGYASRFLVHTSSNTTNSPFLWVTLNVTDSETVTSKQWGTVDCWIVQVQAEVPWTFWIAKELKVAPIQQVKIDQTSFGGPISWWKPPQ